jgi:PEP-CTERM motif
MVNNNTGNRWVFSAATGYYSHSLLGDMKKLHRSTIATTLLTAALIGLGALPALAEPDFNGDIAAQSAGDYFTLTVNPYPSPQEIDGGNVLVGLTSGVLTEYNASDVLIGASDPFLMFCSDFLHDIAQGAIYKVTVESLVTPAGQDPVTYIPDPTPGLNLTLQILQEQALLGANFNGTMPNDSDVQHDIWNLSGATPVITGPDPVLMATLLANAQAAQPFGDYSGAFLLDPAGSGGQAFMPVDIGSFHHVTTPTPEPGTLAMFGLGLGLIGLGSLKLRRNRSQR